MQLFKRQLNGGLALTALALFPITALETQAQYELTQFNVPGVFGFPSGINNNGTITVKSFFGPSVLVKGDSVTPISIPNTRFLSLEGLNAQGTIVGSARGTNSSFGFMRTKQGEVTSLNIPGVLATMPLGINDRGVVVGYAFERDFSSHGFIWDSSGPRLFDAPGAESTQLNEINASGTVVGTCFIGETSRAFTLAGSGFYPLDIPDALSSMANNINNSGQIVGSYRSEVHPEQWRGFIYDRGHVTPVDFVFSDEDAPPTLPPETYDLGDGMIVTVTWVRSERFTGITGINDRGDITGSGSVGYTAAVECDGCGLTPDDFGGLVYLDAFTGERDGSRTMHVKKAADHKPQKILLPRGTELSR